MSNFFYDQLFDDDTRTTRLLTSDGALLIKGFIDQVPSLGITNEWGDTGSTVISSIIDRIHSMARNPYTMRLTDMAAQGLESLKSQYEDSKMINAASEVMNNIQKYTNSGIKSVENYIKAFNWTSCSISSINLSVVLLNDTSDKDVYNDTIKPVIEATTSKLDRSAPFNSVIGIQAPPNGYKVNYNNAVSGVMEGTFVLEVGKIFKFDNIIVTNIEVSPSSVMMMDSSGSPMNKPIYYRVSMSFDFARVLDFEDIDRYIVK